MWCGCRGDTSLSVRVSVRSLQTLKFVCYFCVLWVLLCFHVDQKSLWVLSMSTAQFSALLWRSVASLEGLSARVTARVSMKDKGSLRRGVLKIAGNFRGLYGGFCEGLWKTGSEGELWGSLHGGGSRGDFRGLCGECGGWRACLRGTLGGLYWSL